MCLARLSETTVITSVKSIGLYNGDCLLLIVGWKLNFVDLLYEIHVYKLDHIYDHSFLPEMTDKEREEKQVKK
jgi:hypothetical protein